MQAKFAIKNNGMQMQRRGLVCFIRSCSRNANNLLLNFYYIELKVQSSSFYDSVQEKLFSVFMWKFFTEKISTIFYVWLEYILLVLFVCCLWMCAVDVKARVTVQLFQRKMFHFMQLQRSNCNQSISIQRFFISVGSEGGFRKFNKIIQNEIKST